MREPIVVSFTIETEVTSAYYEELLKFIYHNYLQPSPQRFANVKQTSGDGDYVLGFTFLDTEGKWQIEVRMKTGKPIQVTMMPSHESVPQLVFDRLKEDLFIVVQFFEEYVRRSTLYLAWIQGREVVPEKSPFRRSRIAERIFFGNILFLYVLLFAIGISLFFFIGILAAIVIVVGQFLTVLFADRIVGSMSDWSITKQNPTVYILQYHVPAQERATFAKKYNREKLLQMKKEIYDNTIAIGKQVDCETAREVMLKHGFECSPESLRTKTVNLYDLVEKTTEKYELPVPRIALSNTMIPNAAAAGPSPKHGVVLITTGLLVQLDEEEVRAVLAHELSHLNARDPFVLFGLVTGEYLLRVFVLWPYIQFFGLLYIMFILGAIYFVAKFFEARADLESAIKLGNPKVLAGALRKIGFRRLQFERSSSSRIQDWITWDPHPPIYFRVERLEKLEPTKEIKHTFIQSVKDCIRGFFAAF